MESKEQQFSAAETERMMKVHEVILKAAAGRLKWWEAAEIMGVTVPIQTVEQGAAAVSGAVL